MRFSEIATEAAPIVSRYLGMLGLLWEVVVLKLAFHQDPNPQALLIFGGMVGASLFNQSQQQAQIDIRSIASKILKKPGAPPP